MTNYLLCIILPLNIGDISQHLIGPELVNWPRASSNRKIGIPQNIHNMK